MLRELKSIDCFLGAAAAGAGRVYFIAELHFFIECVYVYVRASARFAGEKAVGWGLFIFVRNINVWIFINKTRGLEITSCNEISRRTEG